LGMIRIASSGSRTRRPAPISARILSRPFGDVLMVASEVALGMAIVGGPVDLCTSLGSCAPRVLWPGWRASHWSSKNSASRPPQPLP
jgi:hypothetical protein